MRFDGLVWIPRFQYDSVNILGPKIQIGFSFASLKPWLQANSFTYKIPYFHNLNFGPKGGAEAKSQFFGFFNIPPYLLYITEREKHSGQFLT